MIIFMMLQAVLHNTQVQIPSGTVGLRPTRLEHSTINHAVLRIFPLCTLSDFITCVILINIRIISRMRIQGIPGRCKAEATSVVDY